MATQSEVAAHLDLSQPAVAGLIDRGVFVSTGKRGALDVDACRVSYLRHLREQAAGRASQSGADLAGERARLAREQADRIEMQNKARRGELIEFTPAIEVIGFHLAQVRTRLLAIPSETAPSLHRCKSVEATRATLESSIVRALGELATEVKTEKTIRRACNQHPVRGHIK